YRCNSSEFLLNLLILSCTESSTTTIYTLSLHDALPILLAGGDLVRRRAGTVMIGAMQPTNVLNRLEERTLLVVPGDREDIILARSEEHTSELQSRENLVCRLLLEKKDNE